MSSMSGTARPTPLPVRPEAIPVELRSTAQWQVWQYVEDRDPETGEIDWNKPPLNARGGAGSSTNARTWSPFDVALAAYRNRKLDGIGFVLCAKKDEAGAVLVAIDLDHCRNPETGEIEPWAKAIIAQLNSYTEVSPSGAGIRIFLYGQLPPQGRKRGHVECYCTARYVTVTGQRVEGTPATIENREAELIAVHKQIWPELHEQPKAAANGRTAPPVDLSDLELIEKARKARNGARFFALWRGDTSGFSSHSEADLALCSYLAFWCGPNSSERIDGLFRQSGLFRSKWNREYYRTRTIRKALEGRSEFYEPRRHPATNGNHAGNANDKDKPPAPPTSTRPKSEQDDLHLTDLGNAQRIVARHGADLRFCHPWKSFVVWGGQRWEADDTGAAVRMAADTQRALYRWATEQLAALAAEGGENEEGRKAKAAQLTKVLQHALKWEEARKIAASLELVRSISGVPIRPADMDRDPFLLNLFNGTIDLRTQELRPHRREDLLMKLAPVVYDPAAACPLWEHCLEKWMAGNTGMGEYLRRVVGYALCGDVSEQVLFFLYGTGANGKSTFLNVVRELMGDYACQAVSELLMAKNTEAHPTERADLFGRRFVATIETEEGKRMAEALMKQLTGGDKVKARWMRKDFFEMAPTWKIFLAANHKPVIRGTDFAVWRRIRLLPFTVTIPEKDKDSGLSEKLRAESSGILNWALRGFREWLSRGLDDPKEVKEATAAYQREQDALADFFSECCTIADFAKVKSSVLFKAYQDWSGDRNITAQAFRKRLNDKGFFSKETSGSWYYQGIGLTALQDDPESSWGGQGW
jgi:putative DNA primase/helicase